MLFFYMTLKGWHGTRDLGKKMLDKLSPINKASLKAWWDFRRTGVSVYLPFFVTSKVVSSGRITNSFFGLEEGWSDNLMRGNGEKAAAV